VKLGIILGTWDGSASEAEDILAVAREAERCAYEIVWVPELYGADAVSLMAWLASSTSRIRVGSAVMQIPARPPTTTAMSVATLAALFGPRITLGLGLSGPQVSEGWYGQPWEDPIGRTREYLEVLRMALDRQRVRHRGRHLQLPLREEQHPLKLVIGEPPHVPVYLAAIGPRNIRLAAELADGWLPALVLPEQFGSSRRLLEQSAADHGRDPATVSIACSTAAVVNDDIETARDVYRPYLALLIGGMGTSTMNFYRTLVSGYGYEAECAAIADAFLGGRRREAEALVPADLIDGLALVGPLSRIKDRLRAFRDAGVDILSIAPSGRTIEEKLSVVRAVADLNS
jgi:F420-dependent oxidoreductase-like protein